MNPLKKHHDGILLNPRVIKSKLAPEYLDEKRIKIRERDRIRSVKRYRENETDFLKTKKKHP